VLRAAVKSVIQAGKIFVASRGNGCTVGATAQTGNLTANGAGADGAGGDGAGGDGAGGDSGCQPFAVKYPAAYPEVITVGATTAKNAVAIYSLWGVDVVAPGGDSAQQIFTTNLGGGYGLISGTSPAAAHVTGAVALALQLRPDLSAQQVQELLQRTAHHLRCCPIDQQGAGLIDVRAMVEALRYAPRQHRSGERKDHSQQGEGD
jgi:subtilisin family serine protease